MIDITIIGPYVGLVGGIVGIIGGVYVLIEKLWLNKPNLGYELGRHQITNYWYDVGVDKEEMKGNSEVEILLSLSNSGGGVLGIGKILVESKNKNYNIAIIPYESEVETRGKEIRSFTLSQKECKNLSLVQEYAPVCKEKDVDAEIQIYNPNFKKIMKIIPIKLHVGTRYPEDERAVEKAIQKMTEIK